MSSTTGSESAPGIPAVSADDGGNQLMVGIVGAALAVSVWGLSSVVAKHITMGGLSLSAYRFGLYALVMGIISTLRGTPITAHTMRLSMWGGIALGADVAFFFSAIKLTTVANATVIGALQPVLLALVGWKFLGERIRARELALGFIAICGAVVVVYATSGSPQWSLSGDLLAVGALLSWAAYFFITKQRDESLNSGEYTIGVSIWVAIINVPLALAFGQSLGWPGGDDFLWLVLIAFGSGVLGHQAMNWSIQRIPLWLGSTLTICVPVVASAAAWLFLDEVLSGAQIIAMAVVLAALTGVVLSQTMGD